MKKTIAISLSIIGIVICGWLFFENIDYLDMPSNKNDAMAIWEKQKTNARTDIDLREKQWITNTIDMQRKYEKELSNIAFRNQFISLIVMAMQLILLVLIIMMPQKTIIEKNSSTLKK